MGLYAGRDERRSGGCMDPAGILKGAELNGGPRMSSGAGMRRLRLGICACAWEMGMVGFLGPMVPVLTMGIGAEICKV